MRASSPPRSCKAAPRFGHELKRGGNAHTVRLPEPATIGFGFGVDVTTHKCRHRLDTALIQRDAGGQAAQNLSSNRSR